MLQTCKGWKTKESTIHFKTFYFSLFWEQDNADENGICQSVCESLAVPLYYQYMILFRTSLLIIIIIYHNYYTNNISVGNIMKLIGMDGIPGQICMTVELKQDVVPSIPAADHQIRLVAGFALMMIVWTESQLRAEDQRVRRTPLPYSYNMIWYSPTCVHIMTECIGAEQLSASFA